MSDRHPSQALAHTIKFRVSAQDHAALIREAEAQRLRVNEMARRLVCAKSRRSPGRPALDPAIVIQMQDVGLRLREIIADGGCTPDLRARIADLCEKIESFINLAIALEDVPWSR